MQDLMVQITDIMSAASRTTGSANINTGIVPDVRVTNVDKRTTRLFPDVRMIKPIWSLLILRATR